jgi:molybdate transport system substrate-binding protein
VRVATASSLGDVLSDLASAYQKAGGPEVQIVLGASDQLAHQIEQGAPFDLFASADPEIAARLADAGVLVPGSVRVLATGRLVAWTRADAPQTLGTMADLSAPGVQRIAIANPDVAPFGRAAVEALKRAGLEPAVKARLVQAENVQQAWRFASTGNADIALTALSVVPPGEGKLLIVDPSLYTPIREVLGVCQTAPRRKEAEAFASFVLAASNWSVLSRHGLGTPEPGGPGGR